MEGYQFLIAIIAMVISGLGVGLVARKKVIALEKECKRWSEYNENKVNAVTKVIDSMQSFSFHNNGIPGCMMTEHILGLRHAVGNPESNASLDFQAAADRTKDVIQYINKVGSAKFYFYITSGGSYCMVDPTTRYAQTGPNMVTGVDPETHTIKPFTIELKETQLVFTDEEGNRFRPKHVQISSFEKPVELLRANRVNIYD